MKKKHEFWGVEKAVFSQPTAAELAEIETKSRTWDADPELQKKYGGNFYVFLAEHIRKKGGE